MGETYPDPLQQLKSFGELENTLIEPHKVDMPTSIIDLNQTPIHPNFCIISLLKVTPSLVSKKP